MWEWLVNFWEMNLLGVTDQSRVPSPPPPPVDAAESLGSLHLLLSVSKTASMGRGRACC